MRLILLYGPPASGKQTIAEKLSEETGIALLHSHMILNDVAQIFGYDNPIRRKLEFEFKMRIMEEAVTEGRDIITTGSITSANVHYYESLVALIKKNGGEVVLIRLTADRETLDERVAHASRKQKINSPQKLKEFLNAYPENLEKFGDGEQFELNTSHLSPDESVQKILTYLQAKKN